MRFYEFEAKRLLAKRGVPTPKGGKFHDEATIKAMLVDLAKAVQAGNLDQEWLTAQAAKSKEVTGYDILEVMGRVG